jgi:hypothetical protein
MFFFIEAVNEILIFCLWVVIHGGHTIVPHRYISLDYLCTMNWNSKFKENIYRRLQAGIHSWTMYGTFDWIKRFSFVWKLFAAVIVISLAFVSDLQLKKKKKATSNSSNFFLNAKSQNSRSLSSFKGFYGNTVYLCIFFVLLFLFVSNI